jgi:hypothetical protein
MRFQPMENYTDERLTANTLERTRHIPLGMIMMKPRAEKGRVEDTAESDKDENTEEKDKSGIHDDESIHVTQPWRELNDVVLYIDTKHVPHILDGSKNHEYRKYRLPDTVKRLWLFENAPIKAITTILDVGPVREPGEVNDPTGIGNDDFDKGLKLSKFGYPIHGVRRLLKPITSKIAKEVFDYDFPTSHFDAPDFFLENCTFDNLELVRRLEVAP